MKKIGMVCSTLLLIACSTTTIEKPQPVKQTALNIPCSYSCQNNGGQPCNYVENTQKPRVTEIMPKKRPCCNDENPNAKEVVPYAPEIYVIAANRTLRSMLNFASPIPNGAKVYVADTVNNEPDMPGGFEKGAEVLKRGLKNSGKFKIVEDREKADYVLGGEVSWYDTATKTVPAIKYSLGLFDNHGHKIGEWNEILHQADGDRSWW